jgi:hypothetical protein
MSVAQSWLIVGGVLNLLLAHLAAYFLYWSRVRSPEQPAQRYGLVSHKVILWNGFLLLGLAVAVDHTGYTPTVNAWLAAAQVVSTLLADGSNLQRWAVGKQDQFREGPEWRVRAIGLAHLIDLVVVSAILVGVARTALGLW